MKRNPILDHETGPSENYPNDDGRTHVWAPLQHEWCVIL